jgi:hypothetical protein
MTQMRAIDLAREIARTEGWSWREPVKATYIRRWLLGSAAWEIISNCDSRGMNVKILIEDATGRILTKAFLRR